MVIFNRALLGANFKCNYIEKITTKEPFNFEQIDSSSAIQKAINSLNSASTGAFTVDAPYYITASAGVYGSKTGDYSHLDLWMELAALSFLGFGAQPPTPEWGSMLNEGRNFMQSAPWLMVYPGLAIFITVVVFNMLGDGLRDILDPRSNEGR